MDWFTTVFATVKIENGLGSVFEVSFLHNLPVAFVQNQHVQAHTLSFLVLTTFDPILRPVLDLFGEENLPCAIFKVNPKFYTTPSVPY